MGPAAASACLTDPIFINIAAAALTRQPLQGAIERQLSLPIRGVVVAHSRPVVGVFQSASAYNYRFKLSIAADLSKAGGLTANS